MAAGSTYTPIATTTLSGATSYTFTSISGSYTDLILVGALTQASSAVNTNIQVGSGSVDTGSNYSQTILYGNGSSAISARQSNQTSWYADYAAAPGVSSDPNAAMWQFQNYSNATTYKSILMRVGKATNGTDAMVGLWRSTSAINTIKLMGSNALYGTLTLYGIKAA